MLLPEFKWKEVVQMALEFVRNEAIASFDAKKMKSKVQGTILRWTAGGLKVQIVDDRYEIRPGQAKYPNES